MPVAAFPAGRRTQPPLQSGVEIVQEYTDRISGVKARRPGLDQLMADGAGLGFGPDRPR
jgi:hypothetical protein